MTDYTTAAREVVILRSRLYAGYNGNHDLAREGVRRFIRFENEEVLSVIDSWAHENNQEWLLEHFWPTGDPNRPRSIPETVARAQLSHWVVHVERRIDIADLSRQSGSAERQRLEREFRHLQAAIVARDDAERELRNPRTDLGRFLETRIALRVGAARWVGGRLVSRPMRPAVQEGIKGLIGWMYQQRRWRRERHEGLVPGRRYPQFDQCWYLGHDGYSFIFLDENLVVRSTTMPAEIIATMARAGQSAAPFAYTAVAIMVFAQILIIGYFAAPIIGSAGTTAGRAIVGAASTTGALVRGAVQVIQIAVRTHGVSGAAFSFVARQSFVFYIEHIITIQGAVGTGAEIVIEVVTGAESGRFDLDPHDVIKCIGNTRLGRRILEIEVQEVVHEGERVAARVRINRLLDATPQNIQRELGNSAENAIHVGRRGQQQETLAQIGTAEQERHRAIRAVEESTVQSSQREQTQQLISGGERRTQQPINRPESGRPRGVQRLRGARQQSVQPSPGSPQARGVEISPASPTPMAQIQRISRTSRRHGGRTYHYTNDGGIWVCTANPGCFPLREEVHHSVQALSPAYRNFSGNPRLALRIVARIDSIVRLGPENAGRHLPNIINNIKEAGYITTPRRIEHMLTMLEHLVDWGQRGNQGSIARMIGDLAGNTNTFLHSYWILNFIHSYRSSIGGRLWQHVSGLEYRTVILAAERRVDVIVEGATWRFEFKSWRNLNASRDTGRQLLRDLQQPGPRNIRWIFENDFDENALKETLYRSIVREIRRGRQESRARIDLERLIAEIEGEWVSMTRKIQRDGIEAAKREYPALMAVYYNEELNRVDINGLNVLIRNLQRFDRHFRDIVLTPRSGPESLFPAAHRH